MSGCSDLEESESVYPVEVEQIAGTDVKRVVFRPEGARRVGLETAKVRGASRRRTIPLAAVVYDPEGRSFAYTSPEPLVYVREEIEIADVEGDRALLTDGPPPGTEVVTAGAAEVYGSEFEVEH